MDDTSFNEKIGKIKERKRKSSKRQGKKIEYSTYERRTFYFYKLDYCGHLKMQKMSLFFVDR